MEEKEKLILEHLKKVSPGTALRTVINDILRSEMGALIVFEVPDIEKVIEGGFRINCRFTPQRLFELCKMDGAIIVSQDLRRILYANALLTPDQTISTNETGTRHKAAERTAKQMNTFIITVSERRRKTTLYLGNIKHSLRTSDEVLREINNSLQILEKQKEIFNELISKINILEVSNLVSVNDVCKIIQRVEIIQRHSEPLKKDFIEAGKDAALMNLRYRELIRGVEVKEEELIRDYAKLSLKKTKTLLQNLTFDGLLETESISRLIFEKELEEIVSPRGFRFLSQLNLSAKEIAMITKEYASLSDLLSDSSNKLEDILKGNTANVKEGIEKLRERILEGKTI